MSDMLKRILAVLVFVLAAAEVCAQSYDTEGRLMVNGKPWVLGQSTMANSARVVIASDQSAIPVSQSGTWNIGTVTTVTTLTGITNPVAVTGTFWQATQPVSGTVTANAGTGTFVVGDGAGAMNVIVDSGAVTVSDGAGALNVIVDSSALPSGAATSALQDGIIKDGAGDTTQANVATGRLSVDGSGVTQPVSGTVTVTDGAGAMNVIVDSGTVTASQGTAAAGSGAWPITVTNTADTVVKPGDAVNNAIRVNIVAGAGSGGTSATDNSAFTGGSTGVTPMGAIYDTTPPTITDGSVGAPRMSANRDLRVQAVDGAGDSATDDANNAIRVNVVAGGAGDGKVLDGTATDQADVEAAVLASAVLEGLVVRPYPPGDGTLTSTIRDTGTSDSLNVAIVDASGNHVTSFGGGTQYAEDTALAAGEQVTMAGVIRDATPASLVDVDGDRTELQVDGTGYLWVNGSGVTQPISAASLPLPAGASTSALQDGIIKDGAGDTTQANVATGRLSVDGSGVTQPVSGTVTAAQATASSLNAEVQGDAASGAAKSGNPVQVGHVFNTTQPTVTTGQAVEAQATARGALIVATGVDGALLVGDGAGALNTVVDSGTLTAVTSITNPVDVVTTSADQITPLGTAADGGAVSGNPVRIAGKDGGGLTQDIITDTAGELQVDVLTMPSVTIGTFPDNEPINVAQLNGVAVTMGNGASGTGVQRVTLANDSTGVLATVTTVTTVTNLTNLPNEGQQTAANSISVTPDTDNDAIGATAAAVPGEAVYIGGTDGTNLTGYYIDPCEREARTVYRVDIVTATTTEIAAAVASEFYWLCSVNLITAAANNVIIVEDDTATNCPSPTAGVSSGGTTAGEGWNFAANGGLVVGIGQKWIAKTTTANRSICIITSAATQLSGTITYVSAP